MIDLKTKQIDVVILAGGRGSRINKHLKNYPKPMIKFNKKHFLYYLINMISKYNFRKIFILTRFRSKIIEKKFNNKVFNFIPVECIKEKKIMGTGGALNLIKKKTKNFLLINGDTIFCIDIDNFLRSSNNKKIGSMSLILNRNKNNKKLGNLNLNKDLIEFKKNGEYSNGGIYYFNKKIFNYIPNNYSSLEDDILPKIIEKKNMTGKIFDNFFIDIGSEQSLKNGNSALLKQFKKPAFFLDRDGVINHDFGYVSNLKRFKFKTDVLKGLKFIQKKNYHIFLVTNQAGIAKKKYKIEDFYKLHRQIKNILFKKKIFIDDTVFSPFHVKAKLKIYKKNSGYRKPGNLMIESLFKRWDIVRNKSIMIGDQKKDELASKKSNIKFQYAKTNFYNQVKKLIN